MGLNVSVQNSALMEIEDGERELDDPIDDLLLCKLFALRLFDEVVHVATLAVAHHNVKGAFLVDEGVAKGHNIDMFELFEQLELSLNSDAFPLRNIAHAESLDDMVGVIQFVLGQKHVSIGSNLY